MKMKMKMIKCIVLWGILSLTWVGTPLIAEADVIVSNVDELKAAIDAVNASPAADRTILLTDGTYKLKWPHLWIARDGVTIRSQSGNRANVILQGQNGMNGGVTEFIFQVCADNVTIQDMTLENVGSHAIIIHGESPYDADRTVIRNLIIRDTYEQMVKVTPSNSNPALYYSENGLMENCLCYYTAGIGPQYYIGGIDVHAGKDWVVRNNVFKNIISPSGTVAEHAIHFWSWSHNTLAENNLIINCDRGIGFGLGSSGHTGGIIRNNMIYHDGSGVYPDVGVSLESSSNTQVYNNTIFFDHTAYPNAIEYRFSGTYGAYLANNLTNKMIVSRDGGSGTVEYNVTNAQASWFVNPAVGDLHLSSAVSTVVDQGTSISGLTTDFDGDTRPQGSGIDIGADEYMTSPGAATLVSPSGTITDTTPTYTWNAVSNATWYDLWVNGPSGNVIKQWYTAAQAGCAGGTGTCTVTPPTTLSNGSHTWWIQTWNSAGYGPWSGGLSFMVSAPPPAATLVAPSGTSCDPTPTYIWNAVSTATWYYLWVNGPSGNVVKQWYTAAQAHCASGTGTCGVAPATTLASGSHTWWVQTYNAAGYGPWSAGKSFTVTPGTVPGAVTLISPTGTTTNPPPYYWWYEDSCATWYYLWVNGPSGNVIKQWYTSAQAKCNGTWCWVTNATTLPAGTNTWWVQTWNSAGYGPWSSGKTFTVGASGSQAVGAVVTVRKQGTGSGTIQFNEQACGPDCPELIVPYTEGVRFTVQAIPETDSRFMGWQTTDGQTVEGTIFYARPGETVIAVFEKQ
jgi:hypothetical protein